MTGQRLFISHASEDATVADRIVAYLEARGAPCWISSRDIPPRAIYADAITEAMQDCSACAVIVSAASNASKAVKRELELASHYDKPFIPIRIDAAEPAAGVDYYLRNTQWLDFKREGERALDRIVGQATGAPAARAAPTPPRAHGSAMAPLLIASALLLVGAGGWFGWAQINRPAQTAALPIDLAGSFLMGSYHWEGVACGEGPTITQEDGALVFTMPGTPTYRQEVVSAERDAGGFALLVQTRVVEPTEHAGEVYALGVNNEVTAVEVVSGGRTDTWDRCSSAEPSPPARSTEARADPWERDDAVVADNAAQQGLAEQQARQDAIERASLERAEREQREAAAHLENAAGQWTGTYSGGFRGPHRWTLSADGNFIDDWGTHGTWTQSGAAITLLYGSGDSRFSRDSRFSGTISGNEMILAGSDFTIHARRN